MRNRGRLLADILMPLLLGLFALGSVSQKPWFAALRIVDVLPLFASGMCFGVALTALFTWLRGPRVGPGD